MARIRTVKPEFFRHEKLQELGPLSMLIFEGLWTQCDRAGRFAWRAKTLKLDILPFITFDMESELNKLADAFFVIQYEHKGDLFGVIPTFLDHQRLTGKEAIEPPKHPAPPEAKPRKTRKLPRSESGSDGEALGKHSGSDETRPVFQEGKGIGKEEEREGNGEGALPALSDPWFSNPDFHRAWTGWEEMRRKAKATPTDLARELNLEKLKALSMHDLPTAIRIIKSSIENNWKGFFPLKENFNGTANGKPHGNAAKGGREFPEALAL
jgi:hypothetical protein